MTINGYDYHFLLTVGASAEIADLCPDGDMTNLAKVLDGKFSDTIGVTAALIAALSRGYEDNKSYAIDGYTPHYLTVGEIRTLTQAQFADLQQEALVAFTESQKTTVEVEESKKNK